MIDGSPLPSKPKEAERVSRFEITLSVYSRIRNALNPAINGNDYEIAAVQREKNGYSISPRRFSHGIGMRQRTAQLNGCVRMEYPLVE